MNGLQSASAVLNGPAAVLSILGKERSMKKPGRAIGESDSAVKRVVHQPRAIDVGTKTGRSQSGCSICAEKNAAVRAFCTATSKPKHRRILLPEDPEHHAGRIDDRHRDARITAERLPIAARVMFACCAACVMIVPTSSTSGHCCRARTRDEWKKRGLTSPATPPTICGTNSEAGGTPPSPKPNVAPAIFQSPKAPADSSHSRKEDECHRQECYRHE